jgi:hypothetical protein
MNSSAHLNYKPWHSTLLFFSAWQNNDKKFYGEDFPPDVMRYILLHKQALDVMFKSALKHVANGEYDPLKALLNENPYLVLLRDDITTTGGLTVANTTLLECAIGASDFAVNDHSLGITEMIIGYFDRVPNGNTALRYQLKRCQICLEELEHQKAYDLTWLVDIIKNSLNEDIQCALKKKNNNSKLRKSIIQFRNDMNLKTITEPHLHYNYQTLIHAFELLETCSMTRNQQALFWRQVIKFLQRSLPAIDRFIFSKGTLYELVENIIPLVRNVKYKYNHTSSFPLCKTSDTCSKDPGFEIAIYGDGDTFIRVSPTNEWSYTLQKLLSNKITRLTELMQKYLKSESTLNITRI